MNIPDDFQKAINDHLSEQSKKVAKVKKRKLSNGKSEADLQKKIISFLNTKTDLLFKADPNGLKLTFGQINLFTKLGILKSGMPDLVIYYPNKGYHGLFLELKKEGTKLFKKDGITYVDDRMKQQSEKMAKLRELGYYADFCIGWDKFEQIFNHYFENVFKI